jgi:hypothetical protein
MVCKDKNSRQEPGSSWILDHIHLDRERQTDGRAERPSLHGKAKKGSDEEDKSTEKQ